MVFQARPRKVHLAIPMMAIVILAWASAPILASFHSPHGVNPGDRVVNRGDGARCLKKRAGHLRFYSMLRYVTVSEWSFER